MSGYTRQSSSDLVPTAVVRSSPLNAEYNKIRDAFTFDVTGTTGHRHDGSSDEGSYVPLIADLDALNKVAIDTGNNRVGFFVEVSSTAVEQVRLEDGVIYPVTDSDVDLGTTGLRFKVIYADDLTLTNNATIGGTLGVTGVTTLGTATITSADINGGTLDGSQVGASSPSTVVGTVITANTGFVGDVTGDVVGNVTGNVTGTITGDITGDVTGDITSSGTSTFNNVTISGTLDMDTGSAATVTGLPNPTLGADAANKTYVDTSISDLVAAAPGTLDTLNELAAALGDDASFSTTVTNSIATKLPLAGGTMSGAIAMGTNKITGLDTPTAGTDATNKTYVDTQRDTRLATAGGTMTGNIVLGSNKATSTATPTTDDDLTRKGYVDTILGSATAAATSAANAATSETNAATSASNASTSETNAAASYDAFDDRYLGDKASDPAVDNDGDALLTGAIYWNTTDSGLKIYTGSAWTTAAFDTSGALVSANNLSDVDSAETSRTNLGLGTAATFSSDQFLSSESSDTINGILTVGGTSVGGAEGGEVHLTKGSGSTLSGDVAIDVSNQSVRFFENGGSSRGAYLDLTECFGGAVSKIWHNSNDGAGSGLDADLLDGLEASSFYQSSDLATQVQAEAGTNNTTLMTPLRTAQTLSALENSVETLTPAATVDIDNSLANFFTLTPTTNTTFTTSNASTVDEFTLIISSADTFSVSGSSYDSVSFSSTTQSATALRVLFNDDGTKMYILGNTVQSLFQYSLSTAFNLSTASYDSVSFSLSSEDSLPYGVAFNTDGTKLFMVGRSSDTVYQYGLSTAFDLSTASYDSVSVSVTTQVSVPVEMSFNNDGTKMYIVGLGADSIYQYSLSTAFDLTTVSYDSVSFDVSGEEPNHSGIVFNSDGTKMFTVGTTNDTVYQYGLSTAFDLSTASYDSISFSVSSQDAAPVGIAFNNDDTKMYILGFSSSNVYQYSLPADAAPTFTYPASFKWSGGTAPTNPTSGQTDVIKAFTVDGGTTWYAEQTGDAMA